MLLSAERKKVNLKKSNRSWTLPVGRELEKAGFSSHFPFLIGFLLSSLLLSLVVSCVCLLLIL